MDKSLIIKGILYIALIPILLGVFTFLSIYVYRLPISTISGLFLYTVLIYGFLLFRGNSYTDSEVVEKVQIPNCPSDIEELIKKTTRNNRLINVRLILVLGKKKKLSQSDLVDQMRKIEIGLTQPAVEKYLSELEKAEILKSEKGYKKKYSLTPKGRWCYKAVKKCFPRTFLFFVIRHYLGKRKLPPFPQ
jgi:DNA-binding MarR family transcriptional regulator